MNIYKYKKNPDYEVSDMEEYIVLFTGNLEQVFIIDKSEIELFNIFDRSISIDGAVGLIIGLYAENETDRINIENDCKDFLQKLIKNKILIVDAS